MGTTITTEPLQRSPYFLYLTIHHYFPLASQEQLNTEITKINIERSLKSNSWFYKTINTRTTQIDIIFQTILFKKQLLEDLTSVGILFDDYRKGLTKDISIEESLARFSLIGQHIHECDFQNYLLNTLTLVSQYMDEPLPLLYQYYKADDNIKHQFTNNINKFKLSLKDAIKEGNRIDCRMSYETVFRDEE